MWIEPSGEQACGELWRSREDAENCGYEEEHWTLVGYDEDGEEL